MGLIEEEFVEEKTILTRKRVWWATVFFVITAVVKAGCLTDALPIN